jgi:hypothetical protein
MKLQYPFVPSSISEQHYGLKPVQEYAEMGVYALVSFSLPFFLGHEQLLVGSAVNCALVLAALNLRGTKLLPVIMLPSLGALAAGYVFGAASSALLLTVPFIWIGNAILVLSMKELFLARGMSRWLSLGIGAASKAAFLFLSASALYYFGLVPAAFLFAMGIIQLGTALAGGAASMVLQEAKRACLRQS